MFIRKAIGSWEMLGIYARRLMAVFILIIFSQSGPVAAGVLSYQLPYMEDFEAPLTNGTPIGQVGAWQSGPADTSMIIADSYSFTATTRPISSSADAQVLHLDTQTDAVTNSFDIPDADQVIYMDTMLKLTTRSSIPESITNDPSVQLFFYLNAETNLVVYNGGMDGAAPAMTAIPGSPLTPGEWNRFTVTLDYANGDGAVERKYFKLQVNGIDITSSQAYSAPGVTGAFDGGAWFFTADQTGPDTIGAVVFEGTGDLDDLVMTTRAPSFTTTPVYYVLSDLLGPGSISPMGEIPVLEGASTQIVYQADPWHEIAGFEQDGSLVPGAIGEQVYTAVFANVQADITNLVEFAESVAGVDGKTPATWYGPLGVNPSLVDEDGDGLSLYEEYLINSHPVVSNSFLISGYDLGSQLPSLNWESLGLPNGLVVTEGSTNLVLGAWLPMNGYLTYQGGFTTWQSTEVVPEEDAAFMRVKVVE